MIFTTDTGEVQPLGIAKQERRGKIVTFYSYKGGTGRSMALANVAFVLASSGKRVLAIDWDLEAPGLHRYFEPFLADRRLQSSTGLMDFFLRFVTAAVSGDAHAGSEWFQPYSNLLAHAMQVDFRFPPGGLLEFVSAGRQDASYANLVNSFNWQTFYEKLGGGVLLEDVKRRLRSQYDFILIDSRTGVSDTSGICTVQMPDELVVCFTLNRQSISGASAAAASAFRQRFVGSKPSLNVWPLMTRVEPSEKERLALARNLARTRFTPLLPQLSPADVDRYWGEVYVPYEPYYAYEEVLALFRDQPSESGSMLAKMVLLAERLVGSKLEMVVPDETRKRDTLALFTAANAQDHIEDFDLIASEYEHIRKVMPFDDERTRLLDQLLGRARHLAGKDVGSMAEHFFRQLPLGTQGNEGHRVVGLALAGLNPQRVHINLVLDGIQNALSQFEQYYALQLATRIFDLIDITAQQQLIIAVREQMGRSIQAGGGARFELATELLSRKTEGSDIESVDAYAEIPWTDEPEPSGYARFQTIQVLLGANTLSMNDCVSGSRRIRYEDAPENHGAFLASRGPHFLRVPAKFRLAKYLVTNQIFAAFVRAESYLRDELWEIGADWRQGMLTQDEEHPTEAGSSNVTRLGPAGWADSKRTPLERPFEPVSGISVLEAEAFVRWCNLNWLPTDGWHWCLPSEDIWELAARGEDGLTYPWGDAFESGKCNSQEAGFKLPTDVRLFEEVSSPYGCVDMAGNLWEFMQRPRTDSSYNCVLRGGAYNNSMTEVRSYLRLTNVPIAHRPLDFGMRLAQSYGEVPSFYRPVPSPK